MNMETLITSAIVVDIAIVFTLFELTALWLFYRWTGRGLAPDEYLLNGLSGLCLMLSLRAALASLWVLMALGLMAAGVVHLIDLYRRTERIANRGSAARQRTRLAN